jgi:hypothetical protein
MGHSTGSSLACCGRSAGKGFKFFLKRNFRISLLIELTVAIGGSSVELQAESFNKEDGDDEDG